MNIISKILLGCSLITVLFTSNANALEGESSDSIKFLSGIGTGVSFYTKPYDERFTAQNIGANGLNHISLSMSILSQNKFEFGAETALCSHRLTYDADKSTRIHNTSLIIKGTYYFDELKALAIRPYTALGIGVSNVYLLPILDAANLNTSYQAEAGISIQNQISIFTVGLKALKVDTVRSSQWIEGNKLNLDSLDQLYVSINANLKFVR